MNRLVLIILGVLALGVVFYFVWKSKTDKQGTSKSAINKAIDNLTGNQTPADNKIGNGITGASIKADQLKDAIASETDYGQKILLQRELAQLLGNASVLSNAYVQGNTVTA